MFENFECTVYIAGKTSRLFKVKQGIQQGAPLSLWFYQMFMNDLLSELLNSNYGGNMNEIKVVCPAYADDMAIVATNHTMLQHMLHIAFMHSRKWHYEFNANKSDILVFGKQDDVFTFWLGNEIVKLSEQVKHLGTCIAIKEQYVQQFVDNKMYKGQQVLQAVQGLGSSAVPVSINVQSKIYWSVAVPIMTYGCELMSFNTNMYETMEKTHRKVAKRAQGLPDQTPNPAVLKLINWKSITAHMDAMKLFFLWNVMLLNDTNIYKNVIIHRIRTWCVNNGKQYGPVAAIMDVAKKYNLHNVVINAIKYNVFMSKVIWKCMVKKTIKEYEDEKVRLLLKMYKGMETCEKCFPQGKMWPWWQHATRYPNLTHKCRKVAKMLLCQYSVRNENVFKNGICSLCETYCNDFLCHVLFECNEYEQMRKYEWNDVQSVMPAGLKLSVNDMTDKQKTLFIFSGLGGVYINEFHKTYDAILEFIVKTYDRNMPHGIRI
jgi:hypothetical protein